MKKNVINLLRFMVLLLVFLSSNQLKGQNRSSFIKPATAEILGLNISGANTIFSVVTTAINEESYLLNKITTYPNPFISSTRFSFGNRNLNSIYSITIYDVTGKIVKQIKNITGTYYDFESGDLVPQVYFYMVHESEKQIGKGKLVILSK